MYLSERPAATTAPDASRRRARRRGAGRVAPTVVLLGLVSLLTDVSSESLSAVLPIYLTAVLGLTPVAFGVIDGLYQGVSALVRILGGWLADRADRPKWVAFLGYGLSAVTKLALIPVHGFAAVTAVVTIDRLGKGLRTAPRDALIAAVSPPESLGRAFGVHRALDTTGAALGPLLAFSVLLLVPGDYTTVFVASFAAALLGLALLGLMSPTCDPGEPRRQRPSSQRQTRQRHRCRSSPPRFGPCGGRGWAGSWWPRRCSACSRSATGSSPLPPAARLLRGDVVPAPLRRHQHGIPRPRRPPRPPR